MTLVRIWAYRRTLSSPHDRDASMVKSHRLLICARCGRQVRICTRCDRGNWYCSEFCAGLARNRSMREAGWRYQQTTAGKRNHAARQHRYRRSLWEKVTHQGPHKDLAEIRPGADTAKESPKQPAGSEEVPHEHDVQPVSKNNETQTIGGQKTETTHCHFCGGLCGEFTRLDPLRSWRTRRGRRRQARPPAA